MWWDWFGKIYRKQIVGLRMPLLGPFRCGFDCPFCLLSRISSNTRCSIGIWIEDFDCNHNNNKDIASSSRCGGSGMEIDRKKHGAGVFDDPNAVAKLEQIVWPHVKTLIANKISTLRQEWHDQPKMQETGDETVHHRRRPVVVLETAVLLDARSTPREIKFVTIYEASCILLMCTPDNPESRDV
jgi:hypothetical protein